MPFSKSIFGQRLRGLRKSRGEAQLKLAALLDVSVPQISDMENGKKTTTLEKFALLCEHYNVSADYLLGRTDESLPYQREDQRP